MATIIPTHLARSRSPRFLLAIAASYILLALAYSLANPPFEATDELRHFRYVRYLTLNHTLPPVSVDSSKELQAHHPPLYYALAAVLTASIQSEAGPDYTPAINPFWGFRYYEPSTDNKNQYLHSPDERWPFSSGTALIVFLARGLSTLFGLGVVLMTYRLARLVFPDQPTLALGAMAFVAFNPTLLHSAASINNDTAAAFFGAWAITEAVAVAQQHTTRYTALRFGLALGLGLMSKVSVGALALLALAWLIPLRHNWRRVIGDGAVIATVLLTLTGWWFARNYFATGDLMGLGDYQAAWQGEADRARLIREALMGLPYAWTTVWARFDYGQIVLPDLAYHLWTLVTLVAAVGLIRAGKRLLTRGLWIAGWALVLSLAGWGVLMVTIPATAHARHILFAYPVIGLLFVAGLSNFGFWILDFKVWDFGTWDFGLLNFGTSRVTRGLCLIFGFWNLGFGIFSLFGFLAPAFAYPTPVTTLPTTAMLAAANFEGAAEIVGYSVAPATAQPGDEVKVTVFWKPLAQTATPLQVFVHLVDSQGIIAAQRDTYPGLGRAVTTRWRVGQVFADTYRVFLPDTIYAPETLTVRVGLWHPAESRPLVANASDAFEMGSLALGPRAGELPNPIQINFDNTATLISYDLDKRVLAAGETLQLQTYWQTDSKLTSDYWAYAHLVGNDSQVWALSDSVILPFTTTWDPTQVNGERRYITLAPDTPPGQYTLAFGVTRVDDQGQSRLPVLAEDGRGLGDQVELAKIRVK